MRLIYIAYVPWIPRLGTYDPNTVSCTCTYILYMHVQRTLAKIVVRRNPGGDRTEGNREDSGGEGKGAISVLLGQGKMVSCTMGAQRALRMGPTR